MFCKDKQGYFILIDNEKYRYIWKHADKNSCFNYIYYYTATVNYEKHYYKIDDVWVKHYDTCMLLNIDKRYIIIEYVGCSGYLSIGHICNVKLNIKNIKNIICCYDSCLIVTDKLIDCLGSTPCNVYTTSENHNIIILELADEYQFFFRDSFKYLGGVEINLKKFSESLKQNIKIFETLDFCGCAVIHKSMFSNKKYNINLHHSNIINLFYDNINTIYLQTDKIIKKYKLEDGNYNFIKDINGIIQKDIFINYDKKIIKYGGNKIPIEFLDENEILCLTKNLKIKSARSAILL